MGLRAVTFFTQPNVGDTFCPRDHPFRTSGENQDLQTLPQLSMFSTSIRLEITIGVRLSKTPFLSQVSLRSKMDPKISVDIKLFFCLTFSGNLLPDFHQLTIFYCVEYDGGVHLFSVLRFWYLFGTVFGFR